MLMVFVITQNSNNSKNFSLLDDVKTMDGEKNEGSYN